MTASNNPFAFPAGKLILSIVGRRRGERIVAATKAAGASGGTVALGRGTATNAVLEFLGIGDSEKDIVLTLVPAELARPVMDALRRTGSQRHGERGVAMMIDLARAAGKLFSGTAAEQGGRSEIRSTSMNQNDGHVLVSFIVNRGYADDAMVAARTAGAKGGTILNARGTGREEDVKFFGVTLVPEKEILLVVTEADKAEAIVEAVRALPCLEAPGSGIAFSLAVEEFAALGEGAAQEG
jgi:nitrogen regulatory protein PII